MSKIFKRKDLMSATAIVAALTIGTDPALSQIALEEIVVTARKRDENLLDVPLSITAFSAADIQASDMTDIRDLSRLTASFNFPDIGQRYIDSPVIRGIAGNDADPTKQSASFFVDGVYVSGSAQNINFNDLERVEVLKGPQSAQFGRATFAGAINFITKAPTNEFTGSFSAKGAEHDEYEVSGAVGGPLVEDKAYFRANARYWTYGGEWTNAGLPQGIDLGGISTTNIGGSLLFTPTDTLEIKARVEYIEDDDGPAAVEKKQGSDQNCFFNTGYICGEVEVDESRLGGTFDEFVAEGFEPGLIRKTWRSSLQFDWELDGVTLSGVAAYNDEDMLRVWDVITELVKIPIFFGFAGAAPGTYAGQIVNDFQFEDYSGELRLQSNGDGPLQWIIGGYYADLDQSFGRVRGAIFIDPPNQRTVKNWAGFGQLSYDFTDQLTASVEGRYQSEKLARRDITTGNVLTLANGVQAQETFKTFLPRFTVDYKPSEDMTLYAQAAKGNKPGDFNTGATVAPEFVVLDEEELWSYELGVKGTAWDNRITYAVAAFWMDVSNQQVRDVTPDFQLLTRNTGEARSRGIELETSIAPMEGFVLRGTFGYADHEFTNFPNEANNQNILGDGDAAGKTSRSTPKYTGSLSASYATAVSDSFDWFLRSDLVYRSKVYATEANLAHTGSLTNVQLRTGLESDMWSAEVYARNIFDDDTPQRIGINTEFVNFPFSAPTVVSLIPSRGQQFGVRLSYDF